MQFQLSEHSHRRYNPLTGQWVQVSPHRSKRPWQGQVESLGDEVKPKHDPGCYLCPGNSRSNGVQNPQYTSTYTFVNDFSSLVEDIPEGNVNEKGLIVAKSERGICKVVCFSPRHDLTIPELSLSEVADVVKKWVDEFKELSALDYINSVQIFENKGQSMGCSNPHPHGQIWAQETVPDEQTKKQLHQLNYFLKHGRTLLSDYLELEVANKERIVVENDSFVALVPFWAVWPFETMIIPKRPMSTIAEMTDSEIVNMADIYRDLTIRYDNLFETSFPYSAGIHQAPASGSNHKEWHWHMVFYPPLLRSATVKKFMVGYEMLSNPQRDITPEFAAEKLRLLPSHHYKQFSASVTA